MKNYRRIRKTYVRQLFQNDCGTACLSMILRFAGLGADAETLRDSITVSENGSSLLALRDQALCYGLTAKCVEMDIEFLRTNVKPCILHTFCEASAGHFQVCYGAIPGRRGYRYLMGDPARGIRWITEDALTEQWISRAALYFDGLAEEPARPGRATWHLLLSEGLMPKGLWLAIPMLNVFTAVLGVSWSWALQRGINSSIADRETRVLTGIVLLLFIIMIGKSLFGYIRQQVMIRVNSAINGHLMSGLIGRIVTSDSDGRKEHDAAYFKKAVTAMMKMQQAFSSFLVTILSDGLLITMILSAMFYMSPVAAAINSVYLGLIIYFTLLTIPALLFDHEHLNELSGAVEKMINKNLCDVSENSFTPDTGSAAAFHIANHERYLGYARLVSEKMTRNSLIQECLGTVNVIGVFIYGIRCLQTESTNYNDFMIIVILSYLITAMMPKICSSFFVVSEGINASRRYHIRFPC